MYNIIIRLGQYYLEWSSVRDAPAMYGMRWPEFRAHYMGMYGLQGLKYLRSVHQALKSYGVTTRHKNLDNFLVLNRAGPNETVLNKEGLYQVYCLGKPVQEEWIVHEYDEPVTLTSQGVTDATQARLIAEQMVNQRTRMIQIDEQGPCHTVSDIFCRGGLCGRIPYSQVCSCEGVIHADSSGIMGVCDKCYTIYYLKDLQ